MKKRNKALVLFSGGLDSILAARLLQEQGIEVIGINFSSHFFSKKNAIHFAKQLKIKLENIDLTKGKNFNQYLKIIEKPQQGYGSAINPCIDCKIFMLKKAKTLMRKHKADFIATGAVLNERPMSQTKKSLLLIEKESGLKGKLLRPLSAGLLLETIAEKKGIIDRNKLLNISGRQRKPQIQLAKKYKLEYPSPAGGCLLCEKAFAEKLRDLFKHKKKIKSSDVKLLKYGRHFRLGQSKIVVGRNESENKMLLKLKNKSDYFFEVPGIGSPITILQGKTGIKIAAALTARYSDSKSDSVNVHYGKAKLNKVIKVLKLEEDKINKIKKIRINPAPKGAVF